MNRYFWAGCLASLLTVNVGCRSAGDNRPWAGQGTPRTSTVVVPPPPMPIAPQPTSGAFAPPGGQPGLPPGAVLTPPPGAQIMQPGQQAPVPIPGQTPPSGQQAPAPIPGQTPPPPAPSIQSRVETQWQQADAREPAPRIDTRRDVPPRINLYAPEPLEKESAGERFSLGAPQIETERKQSDEPPVRKPSVQGTIPPIPQFAVARENVYAGLRPPLDGLDWMQTSGVQTVVQVRLPNQDDSADRTQVEKRRMRYVAFEVSPQTLTQEKVEAFLNLVRGGSKESVFIYDQDGSLAGPLWYLYLRQGEFLDDDASQLRARPLGLQINRDGQHREMWLAVQRLLSENSR